MAGSLPHNVRMQASASSEPADIRVVVHELPAGAVEMAAQSDHCVRVHASPTARGTCKQRRYQYTRGDIDIMPAGLAGSWWSEDATTSLVIRIPPALLQQAAENLGLPCERANVVARHQLRDERIEHVAWALAAEQRAGSAHGRLYTQSLGLALAFHMLGQHGRRAPSRAGLSKRQLTRLDEYIAAHMDRDLSIVRLAEVLAISPSHLKQLFRQSTGRSVHEHVMRQRVQRAKQLLMHSSRAASDIALEAGFAHQSHMAQWLKRILGLTPKEMARPLD